MTGSNSENMEADLSSGKTCFKFLNSKDKMIF